MGNPGGGLGAGGVLCANKMPAAKKKRRISIFFVTDFIFYQLTINSKHKFNKKN
jgi:hypothetical protein